MKKNFELGQKNFLFFFHLCTLYMSQYWFSEIRSNNCAREGFKSQSWAKMSTFIPLSLRLRGIEFSLVSD
jgi:hypothetical protein